MGCGDIGDKMPRAFLLFRNCSRGSRLWTTPSFTALGRWRKPPCSGDMGVSPGPLGKVEGLGILTIWEPGPLGLDFWKPSRLTQRYTPPTAGPLTRDTCPPQDKRTLSHLSNAQHPCSGWTHSNDHLCLTPWCPPRILHGPGLLVVSRKDPRLNSRAPPLVRARCLR